VVKDATISQSGHASGLSVASICRSLPNPQDPSSGIFVLRRLAAMAEFARLRAIQPVPYFPLLARQPAWAKSGAREIDGVSVVHTPMFYVPRYLKSADAFWLKRSVSKTLKGLRDAGALDLVDAHFGYPEGAGAMAAARSLGIPVVVTLRGFETEYLKINGIAQQIRRLLREVDGCICVSHFLKDLALENGANPDRIRVIHNAINRGVFSPGDRREARHRLGLDQDSPIVMSVGHLIDRKRHLVLIGAFSAVKQDFPDAKLFIAGGTEFDVSYTKNLVKKIGDHSLDESVVLLGNIGEKEIADYLCAANAFALLTQREGCCNAILEALASGLPVVTTPVGDNAQFVRDGDNGFIVPVDDELASAAALRKVLSAKAWDKHDISSGLGVGDWSQVGREVIDFFGTTCRAYQSRPNGSGN
jgi:glycosyltransferase involved in cell wall biosynthesis